MRLIGNVPSKAHGQKFQAFLAGQGIESFLDVGRNEQWEIWVLDEDKLKEADAQLSRFLAAPDDEAYARVETRKQETPKAERKSSRGAIIDARSLFSGTRAKPGPVTIVLAALSIAISILSGLGENRAVLAPLMISNYEGTALPEVMRGEIWRLITPIFAHGGLMHIAFNMMWLLDLGAMIEARKNSLTLGLLVLGIGVVSNLGQYYMFGPSFFGMSGVIYGLLGYAWMYTRYAPHAGIFVHRDTVVMMAIWFFLCLTGLMGSIANGAHAFGFAAGIAWGYVSAHVAERT